MACKTLPRRPSSLMTTLLIEAIMKTVSYMLLHWPSESKVEVKFSIDNGQAKLKSVTFLPLPSYKVMSSSCLHFGK